MQPTPSRPTQRRPRADAQRNYERLLVEAETVFAEHGVEAPLEPIARRAGVAIGTLYAHFPNRRALLHALLRDRNDALFAFGDELDSQPAAVALVNWAHAVVAHAAAYRGLAEVLVDGFDDAAGELHASCVTMVTIGERLVTNARSVGAIRDDVTGEDVFAVINAAAWLREHGSVGQSDRMLGFALAGLGLPSDVGL